MESITITQLIAARIAAKRAEDAAVAERRRIDSTIAEFLKDATKPEGSVSAKADGFKVTVTYKLDRKVDSELLQKDYARLAVDVQNIFKWSPSLSVSEFRKLDDRAQIVASKYFETREASPSIKIEAA